MHKKIIVFILVIVALTGCQLGGFFTDDLESGSRSLAGGMNFYFGNLHSHTQYSDGSGTPAQTLAWARDIVGYDFYAVTDHAEQLSSSEWNDINTQVNNYTNQNFVAIRGFEWSDPLMGHINVWNSATYVPCWDTWWLDDFYNWIRDNNLVAQWNHPGDTALFGDFYNMYKFSDSQVPHMAAIETGNGGSGNNDNDYEEYYITALDNGWKPAPTNNQDNHSLSTNSHRTVIIAPVLTRTALLDALRQRRVYSSDDPNMQVIYKVGTAWMGSSLTASGTRTLTIEVTDDENITRIEVITNGGNVAASSTFNSSYVLYQPEVNISGSRYYYVKVYEANTRDSDLAEQVTITSPIWFN